MELSIISEVVVNECKPNLDEALIKLKESEAMCMELRNIADKRGLELDLLREFSSLEKEAYERHIKDANLYFENKEDLTTFINQEYMKIEDLKVI